MTGKAHHANDDGRSARHAQASISNYLREQSKRTSETLRQPSTSISAKNTQRHLHGRTPTTGGHGRATGPR